MFPDGKSSLSVEKPALHFVSLLLDPDFSSGTKITVPSDFGDLVFTGMELLQERGSIPRLRIDFEMADGSFTAVYFGHVSPFKLGAVELTKDGGTAGNFVFSEGADVYLPAEAAMPVSDLPDGIDWKILAVSLYLWRACNSLPNACDSSLKKYFSKMKSVSRFQWENTEYSVENDKIIEKWSATVAGESSIDCVVSVILMDGVITAVKN